MKFSHALQAGLAASLLLSSSLPLAVPAIATGAIITAQVPSTAPVIYVNPSLGTNAPNAGNSETNAFRTITYALQQAQPGTIIQLAAGSYTRDTGEVFPLTVGQNIRLQGDTANNGSTVLIIGGGAFNSPTFGGQNATLRGLNNSEIRGITVTNPNSRGTGVWLEVGSAKIRNNTFTNSLREGIFVTGTATPTIENNVFTQNRGNGVAVVRSAGGEIRDNVFENTGFGIAISDQSTPLVSDNEVRNNVDGIVVGNAARPVLRNNTIENNTRDGVVAVGSAQPDLGTTEDPGGNVIRSNGRYDLHNQTRGNRLLAVGNQIDPGRIQGAVDFVASAGGNSQFGDVAGNWAEAYITALADRQVISGFPDGTFRPNDPVTRAQFAAIVNQAFTPQPKRASVNFADVSSSFWGQQAIQTAYRGGFLTGYPGRVFRPNERIPRLQVLVSLASGLELGSGSVDSLNRFQDAREIPSWAGNAIAAATQRSIVVNYPSVGQLAPNREATRAEVAAFVYQALVSAGQAQPIPSPYVVTP
jgi:parallel beta-helix repeat protein